VRMRLAVACGIAVFAILLTSGCGAPAEAETQPAPTVAPSATPVIMEVTRFVPVTATPTPPATAVCDVGELDSVNEVVIGALLPLSNPGAMRHGFAMQTALNIAIEDVNAAGGVMGKTVRLITYDTSGIPSHGAKYAEQLIAEDCARGIVGMYHSNVAAAVSAVTERYGIPLIIAEAAADELTAERPAGVFRIAPAFSQLVSANANWLASTLSMSGEEQQTVVQVVENSAYGQVLIAQNEEWMTAADIDVKTILVDLPMRDFSPVIARIVDMDQLPDAIFIYLRNGAGMEFQQQLIDAGIGPHNGTLLVNTEMALDAEQFWTVVPDGAYTIVKRNGAWPTTVSPVGHTFAESYRRYFDMWPERYAFAAYDSVRLLADAMNRAGELEPDAIIHALEETDIVLAGGRYSFPYHRDNPPEAEGEPSWMWHQWPNVQILFLQYTEPLQPAEEMRVVWPAVYSTGSGALRPLSNK
jgi:branched-chain amino acid transport system substrate-binding protein